MIISNDGENNVQYACFLYTELPAWVLAFLTPSANTHVQCTIQNITILQHSFQSTQSVTNYELPPLEEKGNIIAQFCLFGSFVQLWMDSDVILQSHSNPQNNAFTGLKSNDPFPMLSNFFLPQNAFSIITIIC